MDLTIILLFLGIFFVLRALTICAAGAWYSLQYPKVRNYYHDDFENMEAAIAERNRLRVVARDRRFELGE